MNSSLLFLLVAFLCIGATSAHPFGVDQMMPEDEQEPQGVEAQDVEAQDVEAQDVETQDVETQDVETQDVETQDVETQRRPSVIKVKFGYYGLSCARGVLRKANIRRSTNWIARLCNGKTSCRGRVHNSVLTDPYGGCPKDFLAVAECSDGRIIANAVRARAGEGQTISLSCC